MKWSSMTFPEIGPAHAPIICQCWPSLSENGNLKTGFGERVDTFFSPRIWHHAGRPTTGHSAETIRKNSKHNGRRTIARYPWNNRRSKPEFLQKMNLTNHFHLIIYTRLTDIWNGSSRSILMILISFESSQWDEYDSSDNFQFENFEKIFNLIILIDNSEKRLAAIFELSLWQQSVFKVFQLLEKHLDQSEIPLQEVKKIRYWPLWGHWSRKIKDFEANSIIWSNIMVKKMNDPL